MSFYWIYDIPNWLLALLTMAIFVTGSVGALLATRGPVRRLVGPPPGHNEAVNVYLGAFGVFYGLTLGLIAVATWQSFDELERLVASEAATIRVLDKSAGWYPQPLRGELRTHLLSYLGFVIGEEWPAQRRGIYLEAEPRLEPYERLLVTFEPATVGQQVIHAETLRAYSHYLELRRQRSFGALSTGLPAVVWFVLLAGAVLSIALTGLISMSSFNVHLVLTAVLATFVGLLIFLIAAMDNPFRGDYSVGADAFEAVRQQMTARPGASPAAPAPSGAGAGGRP